ncbi:replication initiator protein [Apis mellifera associated microvirus 44]|nr:replication initiator protein [Apis mellifera associated microvirus 44]
MKGGGLNGLSSSSSSDCSSSSRSRSSSSRSRAPNRVSHVRCENPFVRGNSVHGCGRCLPCRINRRRLWKVRLGLEALLHSQSAFVTLTYADENLPVAKSSKGSLATLDPVDLRNWLKRLRKAISPSSIRYYAVGEYGDESWRPHYHLALFGYPRCSTLQTTYRLRASTSEKPKCCDHCRLIHDSWGLGRVQVAELNDASAGYIAGYIEKKLTRTDDPRLDGRWPEFARMSLRPGIGAGFMPHYFQALLEHNLDGMADVPSAIRIGDKVVPLGRYLTSQLRKLNGKDGKAPPETLKAVFEEKVLPLLLAARTSADAPSLKEQVLQKNRGARSRLLSLNKIHRQRKHL